MSDDKKYSDERRYAILSTESIKAFAEAGGHAEIPQNVAALLAEDVVYRLREATHVSSRDEIKKLFLCLSVV